MLTWLFKYALVLPFFYLFGTYCLVLYMCHDTVPIIVSDLAAWPETSAFLGLGLITAVAAQKTTAKSRWFVEGVVLGLWKVAESRRNTAPVKAMFLDAVIVGYAKKRLKTKCSTAKGIVRKIQATSA